jgi:hypothetical protein
MRGRYSIILILLLVIFISSVGLAQVDVGGEVKTSIISSDGESDLQESLNLQLFLPESERTSAKFEVDLYINTLDNLSQDNQINTSLKKLYIKHRFDNSNMTIGRQPISWSFGSLLNPVDFNLGAEAMDKEGSAKYVDALEFYLPINWSSGLTLVTSFPEQVGNKYGFRGRTNFKGYDLSLNYIHQTAVDDDVLKERVGMSGKGDLGPIGIYGALNYDLGQRKSTYLVGGDYSFYLNNDLNRVVVQLEYLRDEAGVLDYILGNNYSLSAIEKDVEFILTTTSYEIDQFSNLSLTGGLNLTDNSLLLTPEYKNQLSSNLDLTVGASLFIDEAGNDSRHFEASLVYPF